MEKWIQAIESDQRIQSHLEDVAKYLGLVPSQERYNARIKAMEIISARVRFTQEHIDFFTKYNHHLGGLGFQYRTAEGNIVIRRLGPDEERSGPANELIK